MRNSGFKGCYFIVVLFIGFIIGIISNIPIFIFLPIGLLILGILIHIFDDGK